MLPIVWAAILRHDSFPTAFSVANPGHRSNAFRSFDDRRQGSLHARFPCLTSNAFSRRPHDRRFHHTAGRAVALARSGTMPAGCGCWDCCGSHSTLSQDFQDGRLRISHPCQQPIVQCTPRSQTQDVTLDCHTDPAAAKLAQDFGCLGHRRTVSSSSSVPGTTIEVCEFSGTGMRSFFSAT